MSVTNTKVVGATDGKAGFLGSIGVRFIIDGAEADDRFSLIEHPMSARALAAPLHRHHHEDEYSFVIEGRMGALLGDEHVEAGPGDLVHKPRGQWHTFWNAGDEPCRILEIISPAGFERFFAELIDLGGVAKADPDQLRELCRRYALEMDPDSVPDLIERFRSPLSRRTTRPITRPGGARQSDPGGRKRALPAKPQPLPSLEGGNTRGNEPQKEKIMYMAIRTYSGPGASELFDTLAEREDDVKDLISTVPGFASYEAVRSDGGGQTVTVCQDKTGTDESSRRAAEWVKENIGVRVDAPKVTEGGTVLHF